MILDSLALKKNVVLKFVSKDDVDGNNLYLDNIRVFASCNEMFFAPPISNFNTSDSAVCVDDMVYFGDNSMLNPQFVQWIFPGGIPATSSIETPVIQYKTPGIYDVSLITSNPLGTDTLIKKTTYVWALTQR